MSDLIARRLQGTAGPADPSVGRQDTCTVAARGARTRNENDWRSTSGCIAHGGPAAGDFSPSVWSDKLDYAPGEHVTLRGSHWHPGESVHIFVNDDTGATWN